jgi:inward rectifier potassium channel
VNFSINKTKKKITEKEVIDLGLGSKETPQGQRIINSDGSFNLRRKGIPFLESFNFYHFLVTLSWPKFIAVVFSGYIIINALFGLIYYLIGVENLTGITASSRFEQFLDAFFFSAQAFTTVGFGRVSPISILANIIASLEALFGLLALALATGLLFGRFSRPVAKILFSRNAIIAPFKGMRAFQFRVANRHKSQLIDVEVTVMFSIVEDVEGTGVRKFYNLDLEYKKINFFPSVWTVNHPIDENSPLYTLNSDDFLSGEAEVMILLKGFDDTFSQNVHSRFSYRAEEVVWGVKFTNIFGKDEDGAPIVELDRISSVEPAELPQIQ